MRIPRIGERLFAKRRGISPENSTTFFPLSSFLFLSLFLSIKEKEEVGRGRGKGRIESF
jgi:hypothetical protein